MDTPFVPFPRARGGRRSCRARSSWRRCCGSVAPAARESRLATPDASRYASPGWNTKHPRLQILTIAQLLDGKQIDYPHVTGVTFKKAPKAEAAQPEPEKLPGVGLNRKWSIRPARYP